MDTWGRPSQGRRQPKASAEYLLEAVSSPFRAGKIRLGLEPRYRASAQDGRDLRLADREDGKKGLVYSALVIVERQDGTPAAREGRTFSVQLTPELAAEVAVRGCVLRSKSGRAGPRLGSPGPCPIPVICVYSRTGLPVRSAA